jgi:hypothetical protein
MMIWYLATKSMNYMYNDMLASYLHKIVSLSYSSDLFKVYGFKQTCYPYNDVIILYSE